MIRDARAKTLGGADSGGVGEKEAPFYDGRRWTRRWQSKGGRKVGVGRRSAY